MNPVVVEPKLDEDVEGYAVVADNGTGNFTVVQVPTERPYVALREALVYFEEHVEESEKVMLMAYPHTLKAEDNPQGDF